VFVDGQDRAHDFSTGVLGLQGQRRRGVTSVVFLFGPGALGCERVDAVFEDGRNLLYPHQNARSEPAREYYRAARMRP
jgi:hypothetical protein